MKTENRCRWNFQGSFTHFGVLVEVFLRCGCTLLLTVLASIAFGQPSISIKPIQVNGITAPVGYYTWDSKLGLAGKGWKANETETVHLYGPLNTLGVSPSDRVIGTATSDATGALTRFVEFNWVTDSIYIPFNETNGLETTDNSGIPRPGSYALRVVRPNAHTTFDVASASICIAPNTIPQATAIPWISVGWPRDRGAREGWLADHSPERADPEWISVWSEKPVGIYATIAPTVVLGDVDDPPANQPSFIAHSDLPFTHYGHDVNMELLPDPDYTWTLGTANFVAETKPQKANMGRMECEWETLNNGNPNVGSIGKGLIGMPLWVMPTAGDRIYMIGRWALDNGHPDSGDRTEIHPPRLVVTMRKQHTAVAFNRYGAMTRASQVDIYVSGHGGGANRFPDGLGLTLEDGGVVEDKLTSGDYDTYFAFGPANSALITALDLALRIVNGGGIDPSLIKNVAGPSGLDWFGGPEFRPVNDMDYDFDVPLGPAPYGATHPFVTTTLQPQNTTRVKEVITYTNFVGGLPTVAHFHLPYHLADNGIYAKTFKFYWDVFLAPGKHFLVQVNDVVTKRGGANITNLGQFYCGPGPLYLWTDICGQWVCLTDANPNRLLNSDPSTTAGDGIAPFVDDPANLVHSVKRDVYVEDTDAVRVFTEGYAQRDFDGLFGHDVGKSAYAAGLDLALKQELGTGDNGNVGGSIFQAKAATAAEFAAVQGPHFQPTFRSSANESGPLSSIINGITVPDPLFGVDLTVTYIPRPPVFSSPTSLLDFGKVTLGASQGHTLQITNMGESALNVNAVKVTGSGFSTDPATFQPFTVLPGKSVAMIVRFSPTLVTDGTGSLMLTTNDPLHPFPTFTLKGTPTFASIHVAADTATKPSVPVGTSWTWPVVIANEGNSTLVIKPTIKGRAFGIELPSSYYALGVLVKDIVVPPGSKNSDLSIVFKSPQVLPKFSGSLILTSNDPVTPSTVLTFGAEGVPVGIRAIALQNDGVTPVGVLDELKISGGSLKTPIDLTSQALTTINPPTSWTTLQYHYMGALGPASAAAPYTLKVRQGSVTRFVNFTLGATEFRPIAVVL